MYSSAACTQQDASLFFSVHQTCLSIFCLPYISAHLFSFSFMSFLCGPCRSLHDSLFVRCALAPDGVYRYGVSAWLVTDWG